jgi:hypothetical protein
LNVYVVSPIQDIKHQLSSFNVGFIDKSLSSVCELTNTCATNLKVLNKENGIAPSVEDIKQFYEVYKNDSEINQANVFMCFHPAGMCELYIPFNKTIIIIASTRYELGRHDKERWLLLNKNLQIISENPRQVLTLHIIQLYFVI